MKSTYVSCVAAFVLSVLLFYPDIVQTKCTVSDVPKLTKTFIDRIFDKYGTVASNRTVVETNGLAKLMRNLSLGAIEVVCEPDDRECMKNKYATHKQIKDPLLSRKRRSASDSNNIKHEKDWAKHLGKCVGAKNLTDGFNNTRITKDDFLSLCPALVQQIDAKVCTHYHNRYPAFVDPDGPPSAAQTWGYGFLAITVCSFLSLAVIAVIPCIKKSVYDFMMAYLVALAVGTLAGDAMLHLIPHAFIEGANMAASITVSKDQRLLQHYSQVWRAMFVLAGIYLFFCVEQFMKLKGTIFKGDSHSHEVPMVDPTEDDMEVTEEVGEDGHAHGGHQDGHGHSHGGNKNITRETKVSSVAWMVIVGDGFHNFSDGLAVGAAFSASISSGLGTTIAIFCHELPHELGDFAILLKSGMTMTQAVIYNLVSTVLAYVGLALGIVSGTSELGRHIILSITAGLFLYISLVDMMSEITENEAITHRCCTVLCQHFGLLSGIGIMLFISLYEHNM